MNRYDTGLRVTGIPEWQRFFSSMQSSLGNLSPVASKMANIAESNIKNRTRSGRSVDGGLFAPYAASSKKKGTRDLTDTGKMMNAIRNKISTGRNLVQIVLYFEGAKNKIKGFVHHTGAISGRRNARFRQKESRFFAVSNQDITQLNNVMDRYMKEFLKSYK
jgi:hypothetical protein